MTVQAIFQAVLDFKKDGIAEIVQTELATGTPIETILNHGLIAAMDEVGKQFSQGALFLPEMMMAAQTMKSGLEILRPILVKTDVKPRGTLVIGTVKGDLHDIGKNLVTMMLEGVGFRVLDLGVDVKTEAFLSAVKDNGADFLGLSALLTTTMPAMEETIKRIRKQNPSVKVMIGGAPVTQEYARRIGADGYSGDAAGAVALAKQWVSQQ